LFRRACDVLYDTLGTSEDRLSSLPCNPLTGAVITAGLKDTQHASIVVVVTSASAGLGCPVGMLTAEFAVGLLAIFRFARIVDSDVVAAAFMLISKAFCLAHCGVQRSGREWVLRRASEVV